VVQDDEHVAEITHLLGRAAGWPAGLRWIVGRAKPCRSPSWPKRGAIYAYPFILNVAWRRIRT
jgi:hypothetical protein